MRAPRLESKKWPGYAPQKEGSLDAPQPTGHRGKRLLGSHKVAP